MSYKGTKMGYEELFEASGSIYEIAVRLKYFTDALDEQRGLLEEGGKPDKAILMDNIETFYSDVDDLQDIKETISRIVDYLDDDE